MDIDFCEQRQVELRSQLQRLTSLLSRAHDRLATLRVLAAGLWPDQNELSCPLRGILASPLRFSGTLQHLQLHLPLSPSLATSVLSRLPALSSLQLMLSPVCRTVQPAAGQTPQQQQLAQQQEAVWAPALPAGLTGLTVMLQGHIGILPMDHAWITPNLSTASVAAAKQLRSFTLTDGFRLLPGSPAVLQPQHLQEPEPEQTGK